MKLLMELGNKGRGGKWEEFNVTYYIPSAYNVLTEKSRMLKNFQ